MKLQTEDKNCSSFSEFWNLSCSSSPSIAMGIYTKSRRRETSQSSRWLFTISSAKWNFTKLFINLVLIMSMTSTLMEQVYCYTTTPNSVLAQDLHIGTAINTHLMPVSCPKNLPWNSLNSFAILSTLMIDHQPCNSLISPVLLWLQFTGVTWLFSYWHQIINHVVFNCVPTSVVVDGNSFIK